MKKKTVPVCVAVFFLLAAAVFRFALIGYGTTALLCAGIAVCILLYTFFSKALRIALTVLLILGVLLFAAGEVPVLKAAGGTPEFDADYLIVLGAGVNGADPSLSMLDRLKAAREYLLSHPDCTAILSGGQGDDEALSEAEAMFRWLTANDIPETRLILETDSRRTEENLVNSLSIIPNAESARIAVCSSEYHLYRAQYLARRLGMEVGAIPARTSLPVLRLNYFLREGLGSVYYHLVDRA